ncbi:MAG TPA: tetratricopeptide repeat protein [Silvibacterium sp.]|nr:tetratricopeptide repeat protein [Silvibacterium sp.]
MSVIRFGDFEFDEQTLELHKNGKLTRIQQQPARVLAFLLNHRGSLVTREQIRLAIWGEDTFVDFEQGLNFCIRQIRLALNDHAENPAYVETLPRLGYRLVAKIEKRGESDLTPAKRHLRIGIAPFENLAPSAEDYFAAGLTEDMISAFSRIDPGRLRVTAVPKPEGSESSTERFAGLQRQFNLDYLLHGSVRRSADKVRITVQLHDICDKSILWSDTYDRKSVDLLAMQEEVTQRVSRSLALELLPSATVGARRYSRSSAAYDAYLRGRFLWHKMTSDAIRRSMTYFNEALSLDAGFAPALAGLADCYAQMGSVRVAQMKPLEALAQARSHLQRALDLDETLAEAHCTLGLIKSWYDLDWNGAEREFQVALALDPGQITGLLWQSLLFSAIGRHQEAVASVQRAREIEPLSTSVNLYLGVAQGHAGQYDLSVRQLQQCIELEPGYYRPYMFLGRTLTCIDRYDEAIAALEKALALTPDNIESLAFLASALAGKGERQRALELLKELKATEVRTEPAILIAVIYAQLGMATEMFQCLEQAATLKSTPIYVAVLCHEFSPYFTDQRFRSFLASIGLSHRARN